MTKVSPCTVSWCTATHDTDTDTDTSRHHSATIPQAVDHTGITVLALWAEPLDGRRPGVDAHIAVVGDGDLHIDLIPGEASDWARLLTLTGGPAWLAEALSKGAAMLAPHDGHEDFGQPHRVAEDAPAKVGADRFTWGLIVDVFDAIEKAGYRKGDDQHTGRAIGMLGDLVDTYEGRDER